MRCCIYHTGEQNTWRLPKHVHGKDQEADCCLCVLCQCYTATRCGKKIVRDEVSRAYSCLCACALHHMTAYRDQRASVCFIHVSWSTFPRFFASSCFFIHASCGVADCVDRLVSSVQGRLRAICNFESLNVRAYLYIYVLDQDVMTRVRNRKCLCLLYPSFLFLGVVSGWLNS